VPDSRDTVLTLDLGTSATKAAVWRGAELRGLTRAAIATEHPQPGHDEQDPRDWWRSVARSCAELRQRAPADYEAVSAVGFSAARETFALFDAALHPLGAGILWSDRRGDEEAASMGDPAAFRAATGVVLTGGAHAAKLAWVARHDPDALRRARWILAPRDVVLARLTGAVVTDETLASRTGLCALEGGWRDTARDAYDDRLPPIVAASSVVGDVLPDAARGAWGVGSVHHIAWRVPDGTAQRDIQAAVARAGGFRISDAFISPLDLIELEAYAGGRDGGVRLLKDVGEPLADRHVVIVEDVVDTGLTLHFLCRTLALRNPASLAAVTLLDRPYRRLVDDVPLRHVGFTVPDELFAGYGLGLDERWRAFPDLHLVVPEELPRSATEAA